ncbi:MAG: cbb3-type cytochrome c oxidase subunit II [Verrucomicrobiota bacterium]
MSFRTFILGLSVSFGVAWLAIVVVPFIKMRNLAPIELNEATDGTTGIFFPKRTGRVADGAQVYAENGCYLCHTQVVRPTYAGNDLYRPDWGGLKADADRGDTRRETNAYDFFGEKFAQIGVSRMGPDLSNLGRRVEANYAKDTSATQWLFAHLYNPRQEPDHYQSTCPSYRFLFDEREIEGQASQDALPFGASEGRELVPSSEAKALVSYLLSLKKDQAVPAVLNFSPAKDKAAASK